MPQPSPSTSRAAQEDAALSSGAAGRWRWRCSAATEEKQLQDHVVLMVEKQKLSGLAPPPRLCRAGHGLAAASSVRDPAAPCPFPWFLSAASAAPSSWETSAGLTAPRLLPKTSPYQRGLHQAGAECKMKGAQKPFSPSKPALGAGSVPGPPQEPQGARRTRGW